MTPRQLRSDWVWAWAAIAWAEAGIVWSPLVTGPSVLSVLGPIFTVIAGVVSVAGPTRKHRGPPPRLLSLRQLVEWLETSGVLFALGAFFLFGGGIAALAVSIAR